MHQSYSSRKAVMSPSGVHARSAVGSIGLVRSYLSLLVLDPSGACLNRILRSFAQENSRSVSRAESQRKHTFCRIPAHGGPASGLFLTLRSFRGIRRDFVEVARAGGATSSLVRIIAHRGIRLRRIGRFCGGAYGDMLSTNKVEDSPVWRGAIKAEALSRLTRLRQTLPSAERRPAPVLGSAAVS